MFNKRSFMLGLGLGIIVGAMLLQLFYMGESSQNRLDELGKEIEQGGLPPSSQEPVESGASQASTDSRDQAAAGSEEPVPSPQPEATAATATEAPSDTPLAEETSEPFEPFVVRIKPGMSLTETAELLLQAGAIKDSQSFIDEMKSSSTPVRAGYFLFDRDELNAKQAAAIVSGKPITAKQAERYPAR
jgi:hypothetical protein